MLAFLLSVVVLGACVVAVAVETMSGTGHQPATGSGELPSAWEPWRSIVLGARDRVVRAARTAGRGTASAARLTSAAAARHLQASAEVLQRGGALAAAHARRARAATAPGTRAARRGSRRAARFTATLAHTATRSAGRHTRRTAAAANRGVVRAGAGAAHVATASARSLARGGDAAWRGIRWAAGAGALGLIRAGDATGRRATLAAGTARRGLLRASGAAGRAARRAGGASSRGTDRVGGVASVQTGTAAAPARDTVRRPERATQPSSTAERLAVSAARDGDTAVMTMEPLPSAPPRTEVPPRAAPFDPGPDGAMPTMARSAARAIADAPDPTPGRGPGSARVPDGPAAWPQPHRPEPPDPGSALTGPPPRPQGNGSRPAANGSAPARSLPPRGRPPGQVVPLRPPATTRLKAGGELLVLVTVLGVIASCVLVAVAVVANEALSNL